MGRRDERHPTDGSEVGRKRMWKGYKTMNRVGILAGLREKDPRWVEELRRTADVLRERRCGPAVWLRGLVEISNHCSRNCLYCGLRTSRRDTVRYRMSMEEILECAHQAVAFGYGTLVMQSGEDPGLDVEEMAELIRRIKTEVPTPWGEPLAVTLSLGERSEEELVRWKEAGANRYLLRFETSNRVLYEAIHPRSGRKKPDGTPVEADRIEILRTLRRIGYEVGSGVMVGIPGQTYDDLANDIELFRELRLDMIGVGPYLATPGTPLGEIAASGPGRSDSQTGSSTNSQTESREGQGEGEGFARNVDRNSAKLEERTKECTEGDAEGISERASLFHTEYQVPATAEMTCRVIALARLVCPDANIPATTALATLDTQTGRNQALNSGANVIMPNLTPEKYRGYYAIYPGKAGESETAGKINLEFLRQIDVVGRTVGRGPGHSPAFQKRTM